jgi:hypothetical protein
VNDQISSKDFITYLRFVYCGYEEKSLTVKDDPGSVAIVSLVYGDKQGTSAILDKPIFNPDGVYFLYHSALEKGEIRLAYKAEQYMIKNFSKVVKSNSAKQWKSELIKRITEIFSGPFSNWCHFSTWLDVLWFSHHTKNKTLNSKHKR